MINTSMSAAEEIMEVLKRRSKADYEYINPHFLTDIVTALYDYYQLEDNGVDKWIQGMFSA